MFACLHHGTGKVRLFGSTDAVLKDLKDVFGEDPVKIGQVFRHLTHPAAAGSHAESISDGRLEWWRLPNVNGVVHLGGRK